MELQTAIYLIWKAVDQTSAPQAWADLGAGEGLFANALGARLPPESSILAVDKNESALKSIPLKNRNILLRTQTTDFTTLEFKNKFDGILMANSLHYVQHPVAFLTKLKLQLKRNGRVVVVEYQRDQPNPWVPYPIPFSSLKLIATEAGFTQISLLEEVPSVYQNLKIYSALLG